MRALRGLRQRLRDAEPVTRPPAVMPCVVVDERIQASDVGGYSARTSPAAAGDCAYFDLETTGLGMGARIFLAGYILITRRAADGCEEWRLVQEVARDAAEEGVLLARACERLRLAANIVTYNGLSFDVPLLRRRVAHHRLRALEEIRVVDLVHPARRRYRRLLPDCRLATLEREVTGRERDRRDIPGVEIPLRFRDYVETGNPAFLDPILYHNRVDLLTLVELHRHLTPPPAEVGGQLAPGPVERYIGPAKEKEIR